MFFFIAANFFCLFSTFFVEGGGNSHHGGPNKKGDPQASFSEVRYDFDVSSYFTMNFMVFSKPLAFTVTK